VEVYQDCNVFNTGAFQFASKKGEKEQNCIYLEHGKPLIFGTNREKGIRLDGAGRPEVVNLSDVKEDDLLFHDEASDNPSHAFSLAQMRWPNSPEPLGVFRAVNRPTYDGEVDRQFKKCQADLGQGDLEKLFNSGDTWEVKSRG
ncbi:MAG: 2-oxoacid:ferredoxin oxidoreductase subunit beta, partial [Planctomycetaceae bacterium]|nr:2-oxoacid:ferredoxin oxidoreductase subunit beta [Planctomycetaceae bacterium]